MSGLTKEMEKLAALLEANVAAEEAPAEEAAAEEAAAIECAHCKMQIPATCKFCIHCGKKL